MRPATTTGRRAGMAGLGGGDIHIYINGVTDPREVARQARDELLRHGKRNNGLGGIWVLYR